MHPNGSLESCKCLGGLLLVVRTLSLDRLSGENIWKIDGIAILEKLDNSFGLLSAVALVTCSEYCQKGIKDGHSFVRECQIDIEPGNVHHNAVVHCLGRARHLIRLRTCPSKF